MKKNRKIKIWVGVIVGILVIGFATYKISYNVVAPVIFDFVVGRNPNALLKLSEGEIEIKDDSTENAPENSEGETAVQEEDTKPTDEKNETENSANNAQNPQNSEQTENKGLYSSKTHIGTLTSADLAKVIKVISPADKTRIISICKSCVASKDLPRFARMATKGMTKEDMAYAESYLRSSLSPQQKKEILDIVEKYID